MQRILAPNAASLCLKTHHGNPRPYNPHNIARSPDIIELYDIAPKNDAINCAIAITVYIGCDIRSCELLIEYLHSAIFPSNQYGSVTCGDWAPRSGSRRMGAGLVETIH